MAIQLLPILIGALATAGGVAINQNEVRKAQKRADTANEVLRRNQKRFENEANKNLLTSVRKFGSEERENLRQEVIGENEALLGTTLARDRASDLTASPTGNVSNQFLNRRAEATQGLDERASRRAGLLARVTAPGGVNFRERRGILRGQQTENTGRILQRGQRGVDLLKVEEASRLRPNFLGDLLTGIGPAIATGGVLGAFGSAPGALAQTAATQASTAAALVPGAAVQSAVGASGLSGLGGLPLGTILANTPRRGFSRAN